MLRIYTILGNLTLDDNKPSLAGDQLGKTTIFLVFPIYTLSGLGQKMK